MKGIRTLVVAVSLLLAFQAQAAAQAVASPSALSAGWHSRWVAQSDYPAMTPGEVRAFWIRFRNVGTEAWLKGVWGSQANLAVNGDNRLPFALGMAVGWLWEDRVATTTANLVLPGEVAEFDFSVRAPTAPGTYSLNLRPVVDGRTWMEDEGVFWQIVVKPGASIASSYGRVEAGHNTLLTWSGIESPNAADWVTLARVGSPDGSFEDRDVLDGTADGDVVWEIPNVVQPGTYEFRVYSGATGRRLASSTPVVVVAQSTPKLQIQFTSSTFGIVTLRTAPYARCVFSGVLADGTNVGGSDAPVAADAVGVVSWRYTRPASPKAGSGTHWAACATSDQIEEAEANFSIASAALVVRIISSNYGLVAVTTEAGALCSATAVLPSGRTSTAAGLAFTRVADATGYVAFPYVTVSDTLAGTGTHIVDCSAGGRFASASATFTVYPNGHNSPVTPIPSPTPRAVVIPPPIYTPPAFTCPFASCIPNYPYGIGYPVQCSDGSYSQSGGRSGACSWHGGVAGGKKRR